MIQAQPWRELVVQHAYIIQFSVHYRFDVSSFYSYVIVSYEFDTCIVYIYIIIFADLL